MSHTNKGTNQPTKGDGPAAKREFLAPSLMDQAHSYTFLHEAVHRICTNEPHT